MRRAPSGLFVFLATFTAVVAGLRPVEAASSPWKVMNSPSPGFDYLYGVDGSASDDVWVGGQTGEKVLIEHWNGATWSVVPAPTPSQSQSPIVDIEAVSRTNAWAVGGSLYPDFQPYIEHWDGQSWSLAHLPPFVEGGVTGVSAAGPNDVWATGWYYNSYTDAGAMFLHWDGTQWSQVEAPEAGSDWMDVDARSSSDIWAITTSPRSTSQVYHYDGATWHRSTTPPYGVGHHARFGIVALAADDVWAVTNRVLKSWLSCTSTARRGPRSGFRRSRSPTTACSRSARLARSTYGRSALSAAVTGRP